MVVRVEDSARTSSLRIQGKDALRKGRKVNGLRFTGFTTNSHGNGGLRQAGQFPRYLGVDLS